MRSLPRPAAEADRADRFVLRAFDAELREGQMSPRRCHTLGSVAVDVRPIAQGASERNTSVVIDGRSSGSCTKMRRSPSTKSTD